jgi:hypothetical protein
MKHFEQVLPKNMRIGDVIRILEDETANAQMTVVNVDETTVECIRPYVKLENFTYTGGVIHTIGTEHLTLLKSSSIPMFLIDNIYRGT